MDWKIIVFGAVIAAVHHLLFDQLQAAGFGVYCLSSPSVWMILFHASYVIVQAAAEIVMAVSMSKASAQGQELSQIVAAVDHDDHISLDVSAIDVRADGSKALKVALSRMENAVDNVRSGANIIESSCTEIAQGNLDLSVRTEQTANSLQSATQSVTDLTTAAQSLSDSAQQAQLLADRANAIAIKSRGVAANVVDTMYSIKDSSHKIADIVSVIDSIAFQTNILALNAAVEAARAGEKGRGFAVVASEVRNLASRSATAATEIKALIGMSVERVVAGSSLVEEAGNTMTEVVEAISKVTDIITDISRASVEQANSATQVCASVGQMDQATQQNAALVEEMAAATASLKAQANDLVNSVSIFLVKSPHPLT